MAGLAVVGVAVRDGIAVVTIDNPPVNAASLAVRQGLVAAASRIAADPAVLGAVVQGAGRTFVAGADITEFGRPPVSPTLAEAFAMLEALAKPVCALLHGTTLGGGLELALACHWRVIDPTGSVGLPEVTLGIIPGAGGTQRLPRLIGVVAALDMITSGRRVGAAEALRLGIVDAVASGDRLPFALAFLRERLGTAPRRLSDQVGPAVETIAIEAARAAARRRTPGQLAPERAIDVVVASAGRTLPDGMALEREAFAALRGSPQSIALRHVFFAERAVAKVPELAAGRPRALGRLGVVGGGTMGAGIASAMLLAGFPVTLVERDAAAAEAGRERVEAILGESVRRGKLAAADRDRLLADGFRAEQDRGALADADLVVEAAFEDLDVKRALFAGLGEVVRPDAVLATNTSYLDVAAIAAAAANPDRVIGLHFFSPAHVMKLMEVVVPAGASADAVATGFALGRRLGKTAVRSGNAEGFIGNRVMSAYRKAAEALVLDGASPWEVDEAFQAYGFHLGPFAMQDLAGLDIGWATRRRLAATRDPRERISRVADRLCEAGRLGRKTGAGFYRYDAGGEPRPDPAVEAIVAEERRAAGLVPRAFDPAAISDRLVLAAINAAARLLGEGVALRAGDVDVVMVHGFGWPRWRGGPLHEADARGAAAVLDSLRILQAEDGWFWQPAPLIERLAASGGRFADTGA